MPTDETTTSDATVSDVSAAALAAAGYTPPVHAATNQDSALIKSLLDRVLQLEQDAATAAATAAASAPAARVEQTPEERARAAIDNAGTTLGVEERLAQVYSILDTLAGKVGI